MQSAKLLWVMLAASTMCMLPNGAVAQWANEPSGSTVVVDCPMVSPASCGLVDVYGSLYSTSESAANMVSPPSVQNSRLTAGQSSGGSQVEKGLGAVARDIYLGITLRTNSPFPSFTCCANKMTFLRGPSTNGFFGLHKDSGAAQIYFGHNTGLVNGVQIDNSHVCEGDFGLLGCMQNVSSLPIVHGAWHKLEIYMRSSTSATSRDGILRVWNNGVQIMDYRTLNYPGGFNEWVWTETYGGPTAPTDRIWSIDHVRISLPNCQSGCGGGLTPPAPPPPPPLPPSGVPGTVTDVSAIALDATGVQLSFTGVDDGTGSPAKYDVRQSIIPINWGAAPSVTHGTCSTPFMPNIIGSVTCNITGLSPGTVYQFQMVAYRGTPNAGATFSSSLSNIATVSTPFLSVPAVASFSPLSGPAGTSVVLAGISFDPTLANNTVKINGQTATVTDASATSLTIIVPSGATTGRLSVQTSSGTGFSDQSFVVTVPDSPVIPNSCGCS